jgi:hypothetical protein
MNALANSQFEEIGKFLDGSNLVTVKRYTGQESATERTAKGRRNFQYIITTTEPPPERFKVEPYLRLKLDASRPEDRFLKCDL